MANTYIRARSPKGNVGVTDVVDAGELSAYSAGVISGFTAKSAASWTLQIGGVSGVQDVAIGKNPSGESELFSGTAGQSIGFVIGGAPGTPGQSRTDALVIYKDPFTTSLVNNGVDVTDYQVVPGTAATTGSQVAPNEATIRAAIPTGSLKFYTVLGYVTIANGAGSVTTANYFKNPALLKSNIVADATARALITPVEGMQVYQIDDDAKYVYSGSEWLAFDTKWQTYTPVIYTNNVAATLGNGSAAGKYMRQGKMCTFFMRYVLGSTTSFGGTGAQATTLPFTGAYNATYDGSRPFGVSYVIKSAVASANGNFEMAATGRAFFTYHQYGATPSNNNYIQNTVPATWANGDVFTGSGTYEMA